MEEIAIRNLSKKLLYHFPLKYYLLIDSFSYLFTTSSTIGVRTPDILGEIKNFKIKNKKVINSPTSSASSNSTACSAKHQNALLGNFGLEEEEEGFEVVEDIDGTRRYLGDGDWFDIGRCIHRRYEVVLHCYQLLHLHDIQSPLFVNTLNPTWELTEDISDKILSAKQFYLYVLPMNRREPAFRVFIDLNKLVAVGPHINTIRFNTVGTIFIKIHNTYWTLFDGSDGNEMCRCTDVNTFIISPYKVKGNKRKVGDIPLNGRQEDVNGTREEMPVTNDLVELNSQKYIEINKNKLDEEGRSRYIKMEGVSMEASPIDDLNTTIYTACVTHRKSDGDEGGQSIAVEYDNKKSVSPNSIKMMKHVYGYISSVEMKRRILSGSQKLNEIQQTEKQKSFAFLLQKVKNMNRIRNNLRTKLNEALDGIKNQSNEYKLKATQLNDKTCCGCNGYVLNRDVAVCASNLKNEWSSSGSASSFRHPYISEDTTAIYSHSPSSHPVLYRSPNTPLPHTLETQLPPLSAASIIKQRNFFNSPYTSTAKLRIKYLNDLREQVRQHKQLLLTRSASLSKRLSSIISELRQIFPITHMDEEQLIVGYSISSLQLRSTADDERLSAAFGFIAHLLTMILEYVAFPLDVELVASSSRSYMKRSTSHSVTMYPLYSRNAAERLSFGESIQKLVTLINCILLRRGTHYCGTNTILDNIELLLKSVV